MNTSQLLNGVKTVGVVCNQWGDTGKGKFVDYLAAEWADIVARGTGGANAGHTIRITTAVPDLEVMKCCIPCYQELPGWEGPIRKVKNFEELPWQLRAAVVFLQDEAEVNVTLISVGPDRADTIFVNRPFRDR